MRSVFEPDFLVEDWILHNAWLVFKNSSGTLLYTAFALCAVQLLLLHSTLLQRSVRGTNKDRAHRTKAGFLYGFRIDFWNLTIDNFCLMRIVRSERKHSRLESSRTKFLMRSKGGFTTATVRRPCRPVSTSLEHLTIFVFCIMNDQSLVDLKLKERLLFKHFGIFCPSCKQS